jgi:protein-disulfide isomerase
MSSDESPNVPEPKDRREAVREKAQQVQAKQSRARIARRTSLIVGLVAIVGVAGVGVTWAVQSAASRPAMSPSNLTNDGFVVTAVSGVSDGGSPAIQGSSATPTPTPTSTPTTAGTASPTPSPTSTTSSSVDIRVYVDYYAPGAKQFQLANATQLARWVSQGAVTLSYNPVAMLSAKSNGTKYSLRAASAAACVATYAPKTFFAFNNALLAQQPDQGTDGLSDGQLADLAIASGVDSPKVVRNCVENEDYVTWVKSATDRALQGLPDTKGVSLTGTPMILVNGIPYVGALDDPGEFSGFVLGISSNAYYKTPAASPTPSPTATK